MSCKKSPLARSKILRLFGNRHTAGRMYSCQRWDKLPQQVQTLLSQKQRTFSRIFISLLESRKNFAHFEIKDELHSLNISEIIDPQKYGCFNVHKLLF